jgi:hypothetical protein
LQFEPPESPIVARGLALKQAVNLMGIRRWREVPCEGGNGRRQRMRQ